MRYLTGILIAGLAAYFLVVQAPNSSAQIEAQTPKPTESVVPIQDQPLTAVMFYSNWCAACQILDPKIESVKPAFADRPVNFVKFDFSYALIRGAKLQALADQNQLSNIYAKNKGKTGFMLLIDPANEQVLDVITMRDDANTIAMKLEQGLKRSTAGEA